MHVNGTVHVQVIDNPYPSHRFDDPFLFLIPFHFYRCPTLYFKFSMSDIAYH